MASVSTQPPTADVIHKAASVGFGSKESTAAYERGRPSYPIDAVDFLIQHSLARLPQPADGQAETLLILDVGAGTGIFTRLLADRLRLLSTPTRSFRLTAVEPVAGMREKFREVTPDDLPIVDGSGANLHSAADGSVAAIFVAQAFHWMSTAATLAEFARVLKPGGAVALVWNTRDRREGWVEPLEAIIDGYYAPDVPRQHYGVYKKVFAAALDSFSPLESRILDKGIRQTGDLSVMMDRVLRSVPESNSSRAG